MRKVVPTSQVCHLWANKSQDQARTPTGNVSFTGPCIYSYGSHFMMAAHMDDGRVMINDDSYSSTTSGHQCDMRRALSRTQRDNALHVPQLNANLWEDIGRIRRSTVEMRMPELAQKCIDGIVQDISAMAGKRYGYGPMLGNFAHAKRLEIAGKAIIAYCSNGAKKAPKWPLADLPAELPSKDALPAFIQSYAKAKLLEESEKNYNQALHAYARFKDCIEHGLDGGNNYAIQNLGGMASTVGTCLNVAQARYESATGKKSARVSKLAKQFVALKPAGDALFTAWRTDNALRCIDANIRNMERDYGNLTEAERTDTAKVRRALHMWAMREAIEVLGDAGEHAAAYEKFAKIEQWNDCLIALQNAREQMRIAESFAPNHPGDEAMYCKNAIKQLNLPATGGFPDSFVRLHGDEIDAMRQAATAKIQAYKAAQDAKHATQVADWQAGTINHLPHDAGTYARIKGDIVQTSRGASVPIEHACRLAKIARRIMASGGRIFADGSGPMVGGFRVNSISADGACIIGCHEFDSAEGMRLLAVLENCDACKSVVVETV